MRLCIMIVALLLLLQGGAQASAKKYSYATDVKNGGATFAVYADKKLVLSGKISRNPDSTFTVSSRLTSGKGGDEKKVAIKDEKSLGSELGLGVFYLTVEDTELSTEESDRLGLTIAKDLWKKWALKEEQLTTPEAERALNPPANTGRPNVGTGPNFGPNPGNGLPRVGSPGNPVQSKGTGNGTVDMSVKGFQMTTGGNTASGSPGTPAVKPMAPVTPEVTPARPADPPIEEASLPGLVPGDLAILLVSVNRDRNGMAVARWTVHASGSKAPASPQNMCGEIILRTNAIERKYELLGVRTDGTNVEVAKQTGRGLLAKAWKHNPGDPDGMCRSEKLGPVKETLARVFKTVLLWDEAKAQAAAEKTINGTSRSGLALKDAMGWTAAGWQYR